MAFIYHKGEGNQNSYDKGPQQDAAEEKARSRDTAVTFDNTTHTPTAAEEEKFDNSDVPGWADADTPSAGKRAPIGVVGGKTCKSSGDGNEVVDFKEEEKEGWSEQISSQGWAGGMITEMANTSFGELVSHMCRLGMEWLWAWLQG